MYQLDKRIYMLADGQAGNKLEAAIMNVHEKSYVVSNWGVVLLSESYLLDEASAQFYFSKLSFEHWQIHAGQSTFQYAIRQGEITRQMCFEWLNEKINACTTVLEKIYAHQIGGRFFIQPIYTEDAIFWQALYAKKLYGLFLQQPLSVIEQPVERMYTLRAALQTVVSKNRAATILHKLIQKITAENPSSFFIKQLNLFNICTHFTSGRRHLLKLRKCILQVEAQWGIGPWALTEKERTLFSYMLLREAVMRRDRQQIIAHGLFLIENDRLHNYAIELVVEYSDVLQPLSPQPKALIKNYEANYLEYVFFVLIDALVIEQQFDHAYELLLHYELASCEAIYIALHEHQPEQMPLIEATMQRDIALLVDQSMQHVLESIAVWKTQYGDKQSTYFQLAHSSSKHVSNLLKVLFVNEEDVILEKLLDAYKKYLLNDLHLASLRQFIEQRIVVFEENMNIIL
ncbi:MAG: Fe-S-cluster redox enzyme [Solibacillus sp.]